MNTPNKITLARILLIPVIIFFYLATFIPGGKFIAASLFVIACLTDFLDGYLARKNNQVTDLGKFFDSIADKILIMTGLVLIIGVPVRYEYLVIGRPIQFVSVCIIIMLAREFIISALRQVAAAKGKVLAAEMSGKIKATLQFVTIALYLFYAGFVQETTLLIGDEAKLANLIINIILLVFLSLTTILTVTSGINYIMKNLHVFKETKSSENTTSFQSAPTIEAQTLPETSSKKANQASKNTHLKTQNPLANYDPLIPQALDIFLEIGYASTTMLQRKLSVGYARASKIVDQMEELSLISSLEGKTRKILVTKEEFEKKYN